MKNKKMVMAAGIIAICMCFSACAAKQQENVYADVVSSLNDEAAYAFLVTDNDYNVMLASDMVYDEGREHGAAACCDVYYYSSGKAKKVDSIISEGTAYPISFSKDGIFASSGHSVEKYVIDDKDGMLYLEKGIYESFDESGSASYISTTRGENSPSTEEEYQKLQEEYSESQTVHFSYGASGCINEIVKY